MSKIVLSKKFKKSFRKFASRNQDLQERIEEAIIAMENDVFATNLGTHKLEGKLSGLLSCSCGYDCRIVFLFGNRRRKRGRNYFAVGCWYS
jgi:mRNA interferase YafQ